MSSRRRALVAPVLAVLVTALSACAGGATAGAPTAASPAVAADRARDGRAAAEAADFLQGVADAQERAGSYEFTLAVISGPAAVAMSGTAHLGEAAAAEVVVLVPDQPAMTLRSVGGMGYLSLGDLTGGKFVTVDPTDTSDPLAGPFAEYLSQADPTAGLAEQVAAAVSVTPVGGPVELDGTQMQTYDLVVDVDRMPGRAAQMAASLPAGTELPETLTYTYVLDPAGLPHQVSFDVLGTRVRMGFTHWGSARPVTAPTAEELTTAAAPVG